MAYNMSTGDELRDQQTAVTSKVTPHTTQTERRLFSYLETNSAQYVSLSTISVADAVFVNRWFLHELFGENRPLQGNGVERLFEILSLSNRHNAVLPIKQVVVSRRANGSFRLKWTKDQEDSAAIFLIAISGFLDRLGVLPVQYLRHRYGDNRTAEGEFPIGQVPILFAPFMVSLEQLPGFLDSIYYHAWGSAKGRACQQLLINPTNGAVYPCWRPQLRELADLLPKNSWMNKVLAAMSMYFASRSLGFVFRLARKGERGHFSLNGKTVEYWKESWYRSSKGIILAMNDQLSPKSSSDFLLLENGDATEALFLPRHLVPAAVFGFTRNGARQNNPGSQVGFEALAAEWESHTVGVINPRQLINRLVSIMGSQPQVAGVVADSTGNAWESASSEGESRGN